MKTSLFAIGLLGLAGISQATVVRAFDDTTLNPHYTFSSAKASLATDPNFGSGQVAKFDFVLKGQYASAGMGLGFKDWGTFDFSSLTSITAYLKSDRDRTVQFTITRGTKSLYDTLAKGGKVFTATATALKAGGKVEVKKSQFDFPGWLVSGTTLKDSLAKVWLGADSNDYLKHLDTVLADFRFVQLAVPCELNDGGTAQTCASDSGYLEIDSLAVNGVTIEGADWSDPHNAIGVGHRAIRARSFEANVHGNVLDVALAASASSARIELVRQDGSRVASWSVSGRAASLALPAGLEKGGYFVICQEASGRSVTTIAIVR